MVNLETANDLYEKIHNGASVSDIIEILMTVYEMGFDEGYEKALLDEYEKSIGG